jgi:predicted Zn-dependent peptidase
MGLERPGSRAEQIASQIFTLGRIQPVTEIVAQIDAVDAAAIKRFADATMRMPSIAALGPVGKLESHDTFSTRFARGLRAAE